jgi:uncharacterized paraquat-inducible protein A
MSEKNTTSAMELMITFHADEPIIANIVIVATVLTPIYMATLNFLNKQKKMQIEGKKNIMAYQLQKQKGRPK